MEFRQGALTGVQARSLDWSTVQARSLDWSIMKELRQVSVKKEPYHIIMWDGVLLGGEDAGPAGGAAALTSVRE